MLTVERICTTRSTPKNPQVVQRLANQYAFGKGKALQLLNSSYELVGDGPYDDGEHLLPGGIAEFPTEPVVVTGQNPPVCGCDVASPGGPRSMGTFTIYRYDLRNSGGDEKYPDALGAPKSPRMDR